MNILQNVSGMGQKCFFFLLLLLFLLSASSSFSSFFLLLLFLLSSCFLFVSFYFFIFTFFKLGKGLLTTVITEADTGFEPGPKDWESGIVSTRPPLSYSLTCHLNIYFKLVSLPFSYLHLKLYLHAPTWALCFKIYNYIIYYSKHK